MHAFFHKINVIFIIISSLLILSSCNENKKCRIQLSDSIQYAETPAYFTVEKVNRFVTFEPLKKSNMQNLNNLLQISGNDIWLKIEFEIPEALQYKDLGLFIGQLKTANRAWVNMIPCGSYGRFPPNELPASFGAQHFSLNNSILRQNEKNIIYIQIWTGCQVSLSDNIFIGEELDAYQTAERDSFFKSKLILCFACISFIAFFIYLLLHFFLRKFSTSKTYLYYSILMFFSVITLLPFCLYEIPWVKPKNISYFTIMKVMLSIGVYSTIYFVNKFIVSYIDCKEKKSIEITRIILYFIPLIATLTISEYSQISICALYFFPIIFIQFVFSAIQTVKAMKHKSMRKKIILLLLSVIPALVGFIIDLCTKDFEEIQMTLPQASIYGWQMTTYIFVIRLLKSFSDMYIKNTKLKNKMVKFNAELENEVEIRTKELSEKNFILSRGLEAITLVQQEVLPKTNKTFKGWDIAVKYIPLDNEVSGDLYDYYFTGSKLDGLSIIDISGHGIQAGLMSILAKGIISQQYLDGIANKRTLTQVLIKINEIYVKEKVNVENYFTGLLFNFDDFDTNDICRVQLANAGHPAPILYSTSDNKISEVKYSKPEMQFGFIGVDGLPISFPTTNFYMSQNDILVCFTDGLTEAMNHRKEEFSKKRLMKIINECKNLTANEILENIIKEVDNFIENEPLSDDLTVIVLKRDNSKEYLEEI